MPVKKSYNSFNTSLVLGLLGPYRSCQRELCHPIYRNGPVEVYLDAEAAEAVSINAPLGDVPYFIRSVTRAHRGVVVGPYRTSRDGHTFNIRGRYVTRTGYFTGDVTKRYWIEFAEGKPRSRVARSTKPKKGGKK